MKSPKKNLLKKILQFTYTYMALKQRQNKNDSIKSEIIPILKLPLFSPDSIDGEIARLFQTWNYF